MDKKTNAIFAEDGQVEMVKQALTEHFEKEFASDEMPGMGVHYVECRERTNSDERAQMKAFVEGMAWMAGR